MFDGRERSLDQAAVGDSNDDVLGSETLAQIVREMMATPPESLPISVTSSRWLTYSGIFGSAACGA